MGVEFAVRPDNRVELRARRGPALRREWLSPVVLFLIAAANCLLGYSLEHLSDEIGRTFRKLEVPEDYLPLLTQAAIRMYILFYALTIPVLGVAALGYSDRLRQAALMWTTVAVLVFDAVALFISLWGFCIPFLPWGIEIDRWTN